MKWILQPGMMVLLFALTSTQAMSFNGNIGILFALPNIAIDAKSGLSPDIVNRVDRVETVESLRKGAGFIISKFDSNIVKEFSMAWQQAGNGTTDQESVVLILRTISGQYMARILGATNEHRSFTFRWHPGAVAIVHTHPNNASPKPQKADCQIADKYGVPIFTITSKGMYVYDPYTKQITIVQHGLTWLEPASWRR
jgi:hypothetical protein